MKRIEIKEKLIEEIKQIEEVQLLKMLYTLITAETKEKRYRLSEAQFSAIAEAREQYRNGKTFTNEQPDLEIEEEYFSKLTASGEYQDRSEIVREALYLHRISREKAIGNLRKEIDLGWDGPDSSMTMDQIIESKKNP